MIRPLHRSVQRGFILTTGKGTKYEKKNMQAQS